MNGPDVSVLLRPHTGALIAASVLQMPAKVNIGLPQGRAWGKLRACTFTHGGIMDAQILHLSRLNRASDTDFALDPDAGVRKRIAAELGINAVRKLRLHGTIIAEDKSDWRLEARLGATVVQECVVTLEPVVTRIDVDLTRSYRTDLPEPTGDDFEIPEDDTIEPLPQKLDLSALMIEALALALPDYPRAPGVELGEAVFAAPGVAPMTDEDAKPLAGLAALRDKLQEGATDTDDDT